MRQISGVLKRPYVTYCKLTVLSNSYPDIIEGILIGNNTLEIA